MQAAAIAATAAFASAASEAELAAAAGLLQALYGLAWSGSSTACRALAQHAQQLSASRVMALWGPGKPDQQRSAPEATFMQVSAQPTPCRA